MEHEVCSNNLNLIEMKKETKKKLLIGGTALLAIGTAYMIGKRRGEIKGAVKGVKAGLVIGQKAMHYYHQEAYSSNGNITRDELNNYCRNVLGTNNAEMREMTAKGFIFTTEAPKK